MFENSQKTHQQLAEEKKLYLVEMRKENMNYPKVVAKPSEIRKPDEIKSTEIMDFTQYVLGGKVVLSKNSIAPFYEKFRSYRMKKRKMEYHRNQDHVRIRMYAEHGELRSFLTDKYPEAKPRFWRKNRQTESEQVE